MKSSYQPLFDTRNISISVNYPGASPGEMEEGVVLKIENNLKGIVGIYKVTSVSKENLATINIEIERGENIDVVFDGADQIDHQKYLIKGGGGALLRENILINAAKKVVIMADKSKFVKNFNRAVPVEVHPLARNTVTKSIRKLGGKPMVRTLERGYPFITENGNVILDCNFGIIKKPKALAQKIKLIAGVMEVGIFTRKPDVIYKAKSSGKFEIIT